MAVFTPFQTMVGQLEYCINKTCSYQEIIKIICICWALQIQVLDICTLQLFKDLCVLSSVVCVCCGVIFAHECRCLQRPEVSDPLELDLQVIVSYRVVRSNSRSLLEHPVLFITLQLLQFLLNTLYNIYLKIVMKTESYVFAPNTHNIYIQKYKVALL